MAGNLFDLIGFAAEFVKKNIIKGKILGTVYFL